MFVSGSLISPQTSTATCGQTPLPVHPFFLGPLPCLLQNLSKPPFTRSNRSSTHTKCTEEYLNAENKSSSFSICADPGERAFTPHLMSHELLMNLLYTEIPKLDIHSRLRTMPSCRLSHLLDKTSLQGEGWCGWHLPSGIK